MTQQRIDEINRIADAAASKPLTEKQKYDIIQVVANIELEDMHVPEDVIRELALIASGAKTVEQSIKEVNMQYQQ